jgi:hypothetical protein
VSHVLRRPFITDDPANLNDGRKAIFVSRLAWPKPDVLAIQGRPVGSRATARTWPATEHDVANLLYAYVVGYRGMLFLHPPDGDIWTALAARIEKERSKP